MSDNINSHSESSRDNSSVEFQQKKVLTMSSVRFMLVGFVLIISNNFGSCNVLRETASDEIEKRGVNIPVSYKYNYCIMTYLKRASVK
jgi:hypothetical protein